MSISAARVILVVACVVAALQVVDAADERKDLMRAAMRLAYTTESGSGGFPTFHHRGRNFGVKLIDGSCVRWTRVNTKHTKGMDIAETWRFIDSAAAKLKPKPGFFAIPTFDHADQYREDYYGTDRGNRYMTVMLLDKSCADYVSRPATATHNDDAGFDQRMKDADALATSLPGYGAGWPTFHQGSKDGRTTYGYVMIHDANVRHFSARKPIMYAMGRFERGALMSVDDWFSPVLPGIRLAVESADSCAWLQGLDPDWPEVSPLLPSLYRTFEKRMRLRNQGVLDPGYCTNSLFGEEECADPTWAWWGWEGRVEVLRGVTFKGSRDIGLFMSLAPGLSVTRNNIYNMLSTPERVASTLLHELAHVAYTDHCDIGAQGCDMHEYANSIPNRMGLCAQPALTAAGDSRWNDLTGHAWVPGKTPEEMLAEYIEESNIDYS